MSLFSMLSEKVNRIVEFSAEKASNIFTARNFRFATRFADEFSKNEEAQDSALKAAKQAVLAATTVAAAISAPVAFGAGIAAAVASDPKGCMKAAKEVKDDVIENARKAQKLYKDFSKREAVDEFVAENGEFIAKDYKEEDSLDTRNIKHTDVQEDGVSFVNLDAAPRENSTSNETPQPNKVEEVVFLAENSSAKPESNLSKKKVGAVKREEFSFVML